MPSDVVNHPTRDVIAIAGPTASGKSDVAMALAEKFNGELIACDSVQVYRGFDIGAAKPTLAERARVPHHLVDVANWNDGYDAQRWADAARAAIDDIVRRERRPIVVGGTGLYLRALRFGLADVAPARPELRAELEAREKGQPGSAYTQLVALDPEGAKSIEPRNLVHVIRAIEICLGAGEPQSQVKARHGFRAPVVPMRIFALDWDSAKLRGRIAERVTRMTHDGLLEEVTALLQRGVAPDCRPMRAVGYREAVRVVLGEEPRDGLEERICKSTWSYARRQRTWLRRERDVTMITLHDVESAIAALVDILI